MSDEPTTGSALAPDEEQRPAGGGRASRRQAQSSGSFLRELPFLVVIAFVLALVLKAFLVQAFYIPSGSMEHTLEISDRVLVNKLVYRFRDVHRGEIVVFNGEGNFGDNEEVAPLPEGNGVTNVLRGFARAIGVGPPGEMDFIKRVIGVGGDRVACCVDGKVTVQPPNGLPVPLTEPYLFDPSTETPFCEAGDSVELCPPGAPGILVPEGRLWVMGDHRDASADSRSHLAQNSGTVPTDHVVGRAFVVVWPFSRATLLRVPESLSGRSLALPALPGAAAQGTPLALGLVGAVPLTLLRRRLRDRGPWSGPGRRLRRRSRVGRSGGART